MKPIEQNICAQEPASLYQRIGGEAGVERLVERIYHWMQQLPEASDVLAMHHPDLTEVKARLRAFLSGWLGGPDLFRPVYGEPRMRRRHFAFEIDAAARDAWMACLCRAVDETVAEPALAGELKSVFQAMADHLRNVRSPRDQQPLSGCGCGNPHGGHATRSPGP